MTEQETNITYLQNSRPHIEAICAELSSLLQQKADGYGPTWHQVTQIMRALYPSGAPIEAFDDMLLIVRVLDKLCRLANRPPGEPDAGGEDPWFDVAGYGVVGVMKGRMSQT